MAKLSELVVVTEIVVSLATELQLKSRPIVALSDYKRLDINC